MKKIKGLPQKIIILYTTIIFSICLLFPMYNILIKSFSTEKGFTFGIYQRLFLEERIGEAFFNSVTISSISGLITTISAFVVAYAVNYTNIHNEIKKVISVLVMLPMLLPTITLTLSEKSISKCLKPLKLWIISLFMYIRILPRYQVK